MYIYIYTHHVFPSKQGHVGKTKIPGCQVEPAEPAMLAPRPPGGSPVLSIFGHIICNVCMQYIYIQDIYICIYVCMYRDVYIHI